MASASKASLYVLFSGQGSNEIYFNELQTLYDIYTYVTEFLTTITNEVLKPLATASTSTYYTYGMNIIFWLSGTKITPPNEYLMSILLSLPLIGLMQLTQYLVVCQVAGLTPGEMCSLIAGATGHSQGVGSAVCISASLTFKSFTLNAMKTL